MQNIISGLNKAFDNRIRLGIMSVLMVTDNADFNSLKKMLDLTDGNLASHAAALEKLDFIRVEKQFVGKKPNTRYAVTREGRKAFSEHLDALEKLISSNN
ncbi:MAG: transcriptional regulator [Bacteroidetes bacterium]|nr:transcriptional regulator [Bacteroidota bacterium]MBU1717752.1 transcriptional regulator [Bacteroidota bacterium]